MFWAWGSGSCRVWVLSFIVQLWGFRVWSLESSAGVQVAGLELEIGRLELEFGIFQGLEWEFGGNRRRAGRASLLPHPA